MYFKSQNTFWNSAKQPWSYGYSEHSWQLTDHFRSTLGLPALGCLGQSQRKLLATAKLLTLVGRLRMGVCSVAQSSQTLCNPMDCSLPGSSVHGILQARILEWVTISFSRDSFHPRDRTNVFYISFTGRQILYHWESGGLFLPILLLLLFRHSIVSDSLQPNGL